MRAAIKTKMAVVDWSKAELKRLSDSEKQREQIAMLQFLLANFSRDVDCNTCSSTAILTLQYCDKGSELQYFMLQYCDNKGSVLQY